VKLARVLLKGRPTPSQLTDRLAPPWPGGLELYLDRADVVTEDECKAVIGRIKERELPPGFAFVVEGPLRGLDNEFFDLSICNDATKEMIRRLGWMAQEIGADGVVMHCIMPRFSLEDDVWERRDEIFATCMEFVQFYVDTLVSMGVTPTLENVPPVLRMRESRYLFTPVGMAPEDVRWFLDHAPGLQATLDISHGQLYVNARAMAERGEGDAEVQPLMRYLQNFPLISSVEAFVDVLEPSIFEAHVSNASGLLGEGARYDDGDIDMNRVIGRLARTARYLVTETIEPDNDKADLMREAQQGMESVIERISEQHED
jgi:sugar phosphate isomerase/epimerase